MAAGLKCGGTLHERAERLWMTRGKERCDWDPKAFVKPPRAPPPAAAAAARPPPILPADPPPRSMSSTTLKSLAESPPTE